MMRLTASQLPSYRIYLTTATPLLCDTFHSVDVRGEPNSPRSEFGHRESPSLEADSATTKDGSYSQSVAYTQELTPLRETKWNQYIYTCISPIHLQNVESGYCIAVDIPPEQESATQVTTSAYHTDMSCGATTLSYNGTVSFEDISAIQNVQAESSNVPDSSRYSPVADGIDDSYCSVMSGTSALQSQHGCSSEEENCTYMSVKSDCSYADSSYISTSDQLDNSGQGSQMTGATNHSGTICVLTRKFEIIQGRTRETDNVEVSGITAMEDSSAAHANSCKYQISTQSPHVNSILDENMTKDLTIATIQSATEITRDSGTTTGNISASFNVNTRSDDVSNLYLDQVTSMVVSESNTSTSTIYDCGQIAEFVRETTSDAVACVEKQDSQRNASSRQDNSDECSKTQTYKSTSFCSHSKSSQSISESIIYNECGENADKSIVYNETEYSKQFPNGQFQASVCPTAKISKHIHAAEDFMKTQVVLPQDNQSPAHNQAMASIQAQTRVKFCCKSPCLITDPLGGDHLLHPASTCTKELNICWESRSRFISTEALVLDGHSATIVASSNTRRFPAHGAEQKKSEAPVVQSTSVSICASGLEDSVESGQADYAYQATIVDSLQPVSCSKLVSDLSDAQHLSTAVEVSGVTSDSILKEITLLETMLSAVQSTSKDEDKHQHVPRQRTCATQDKHVENCTEADDPCLVKDSTPQCIHFEASKSDTHKQQKTRLKTVEGVKSANSLQQLERANVRRSARLKNFRKDFQAHNDNVDEATRTPFCNNPQVKHQRKTCKSAAKSGILSCDINAGRLNRIYAHTPVKAKASESLQAGPCFIVSKRVNFTRAQQVVLAGKSARQSNPLNDVCITPYNEEVKGTLSDSNVCMHDVPRTDSETNVAMVPLSEDQCSIVVEDYPKSTFRDECIKKENGKKSMATSSAIKLSQILNDNHSMSAHSPLRRSKPKTRAISPSPIHVGNQLNLQLSAMHLNDVSAEFTHAHIESIELNPVVASTQEMTTNNSSESPDATVLDLKPHNEEKPTIYQCKEMSCSGEYLCADGFSTIPEKPIISSTPAKHVDMELLLNLNQRDERAKQLLSFSANKHSIHDHSDLVEESTIEKVYPVADCDLSSAEDGQYSDAYFSSAYQSSLLDTEPLQKGYFKVLEADVQIPGTVGMNDYKRSTEHGTLLKVERKTHSSVNVEEGIQNLCCLSTREQVPLPKLTVRKLRRRPQLLPPTPEISQTESAESHCPTNALDDDSPNGNNCKGGSVGSTTQLYEKQNPLLKQQHEEVRKEKPITCLLKTEEASSGSEKMPTTLSSSSGVLGSCAPLRKAIHAARIKSTKAQGVSKQHAYCRRTVFKSAMKEMVSNANSTMSLRKSLKPNGIRVKKVRANKRCKTVKQEKNESTSRSSLSTRSFELDKQQYLGLFAEDSFENGSVDVCHQRICYPLSVSCQMDNELNEVPPTDFIIQRGFEKPWVVYPEEQVLKNKNELHLCIENGQNMLPSRKAAMNLALPPVSKESVDQRVLFPNNNVSVSIHCLGRVAIQHVKTLKDGTIVMRDGIDKLSNNNKEVEGELTGSGDQSSLETQTSRKNIKNIPHKILESDHSSCKSYSSSTSTCENLLTEYLLSCESAAAAASEYKPCKSMKVSSYDLESKSSLLRLSQQDHAAVISRLGTSDWNIEKMSPELLAQPPSYGLHPKNTGDTMSGQYMPSIMELSNTHGDERSSSCGKSYASAEKSNADINSSHPQSDIQNPENGHKILCVSEREQKDFYGFDGVSSTSDEFNNSLRNYLLLTSSNPAVKDSGPKHSIRYASARGRDTSSQGRFFVRSREERLKQMQIFMEFPQTKQLNQSWPIWKTPKLHGKGSGTIRLSSTNRKSQKKGIQSYKTNSKVKKARKSAPVRLLTRDNSSSPSLPDPYYLSDTSYFVERSHLYKNSSAPKQWRVSTSGCDSSNVKETTSCCSTGDPAGKTSATNLPTLPPTEKDEIYGDIVSFSEVKVRSKLFIQEDGNVSGDGNSIISKAAMPFRPVMKKRKFGENSTHQECSSTSTPSKLASGIISADICCPSLSKERSFKSKKVGGNMYKKTTKSTKEMTSHKSELAVETKRMDTKFQIDMNFSSTHSLFEQNSPTNDQSFTHKKVPSCRKLYTNDLLLEECASQLSQQTVQSLCGKKAFKPKFTRKLATPSQVDPLLSLMAH